MYVHIALALTSESQGGCGVCMYTVYAYFHCVLGLPLSAEAFHYFHIIQDPTCPYDVYNTRKRGMPGTRHADC